MSVDKMNKNQEIIDDLEIEPLSDEALELVAGGKSSDGDSCCSCEQCSNGGDGGNDDNDNTIKVPVEITP